MSVRFFPLLSNDVRECFRLRHKHDARFIGVLFGVLRRHRECVRRLVSLTRRVGDVGRWSVGERVESSGGEG
jgi:hypothetical protein